MDANQLANTVAVVEDDELIAELIKETLSEEVGYQVVIIRHGTGAVETIRSIKVSLILLDLNLPGMNGLQIFDLLQADAATSTIPIIFVTATPDFKAFEARNIKDYIEKPFELDELVDRVTRLCHA